MTVALSIIALCISVAAFTLSLLKHFQGGKTSKYLQHRDSLVLAKSVLLEAVTLRERIRHIEHDVLDGAFEDIESLAEKLVVVSDQLRNLDPLEAPLDVLHDVEIKLHRFSIELASWHSMVEGVAGWWGDSETQRIGMSNNAQHHKSDRAGESEALQEEGT